MGPRHCCRGISVQATDRTRNVITLQWGRGIAAAESRADGRDPAGGHGRFNGAAALLPRNLRRMSATLSQSSEASMGPRHCCRGISALMDVSVFLSVLTHCASASAFQPTCPDTAHVCHLLSSLLRRQLKWLQRRECCRVFPRHPTARAARHAFLHTTCACRFTCVNPLPSDSILLIGRPSVGPRSTMSTWSS
jgi:hypothetical protein